jgi:hypothetical protein
MLLKLRSKFDGRQQSGRFPGLHPPSTRVTSWKPRSRRTAAARRLRRPERQTRIIGRSAASTSTALQQSRQRHRLSLGDMRPTELARLAHVQDDWLLRADAKRKVRHNSRGSMSASAKAIGGHGPPTPRPAICRSDRTAWADSGIRGRRAPGTRKCTRPGRARGGRGARRRRIFIQQVLARLDRSGSPSSPSAARPGTDAHQKDVAAPIAIGAHQALQHMDAAEIDLVDVVHADEQKALSGVLGGHVENLFLDVVDRPEVEIALNLDDTNWGQSGASGRWAKCWKPLRRARPPEPAARWCASNRARMKAGCRSTRRNPDSRNSVPER